MDAYPQIMLDLAGGHSRILKLSTNPRRCSGAGSSWKCSEVTHLRREVAGESMKAGFGRSSSEDVRRGLCGTGSQNTQPLLGEAVKRAGVPEEGLDEGGRVCPSGRSYRRRILFSVDSFSVLDTGQDQLSRGSGIRT